LSANASASFISYSRVDSEFALRLAEDLKAAGANVWLDQLDIPPGQEWDSAIESTLIQSPWMLLILSPSAATSRSVRNEIAFALDKEKTIVPVLYRDCEVPLQLRRIQHIDFRSDYSRGLKALLKALGVKAPQPDVPVGAGVAAGGYPSSTRAEKKQGLKTIFPSEPPKKRYGWLIAGIVLVVLWLGGFLVFHTVGFLIHILLILAVTSFIIYFFRRGSRA
jgi:hypothetical protein